MSTVPRIFSTGKDETQNNRLGIKKLVHATLFDLNIDHFFNNFDCTAKEIYRLVLFGKTEGLKFFRELHAHKNDALLDLSKSLWTREEFAKIEDRLSKVRSFSQVVEKQIMQSGESTDWQIHSVCCFTQTHSWKLLGRGFTEIYDEKSYSRLPHVKGEERAIFWQFMLFLSSCSWFVCKTSIEKNAARRLIFP